MNRIALTYLLMLVLVADCSGLTGGRTVVEGAAPDDLLKLRGGSGLGFRCGEAFRQNATGAAA